MELGYNTVDALCSRVDLTQAKPILDLSQITFFRPFGLVYLGMFLRHHNSRGKTFTVLPPTYAAARDYLTRQNFWERFNFPSKWIANERQRRRTTSTSLNDIVDIEQRDDIAEDVAESVLGVLRRNVVGLRASRVSELVSELVDNFAIHSEQPLAVFTMQYYPNMHETVLAVGDCGIGIRTSLCRNPVFAHLSSHPHYRAAVKAFEPLVSCRGEGGTGLTEVRDGIVELGGRLILSTGDGYVRIDRTGEFRYGRMSYDMAGVQVQLAFPDGS